jgi:hypothetical protein
MDSFILDHIPACPPRSQIDHVLAVIRPDMETTVFVNELTRNAAIRPNRSIKKGDAILKKDILDVYEISLGVEIPADCGFAYIQSFKWRKSIFYDFGPLLESPRFRDYDLKRALGFHWAYLLFQESLNIEDHVWEELFRQGWFPFRHMPPDVLSSILNHARVKWLIDEIFLSEDVLGKIDNALQLALSGFKSPIFNLHFQLIQNSVSSFLRRDYLNVVTLVYTRIEGILRSLHAEFGQGKPKQSNLITAATSKYEQRFGPAGMLLPEKFRKYLNEVIFRSWQSPEPANFVSRHTVAHGVAPLEAYNQCAAIVGLFAVMQLALYVTKDADSNNLSG